MELKPVGEMRQPQYPQREQMRDNSHLLLERIPHGWRRFGKQSLCWRRRVLRVVEAVKTL